MARLTPAQKEIIIAAVRERKKESTIVNFRRLAVELKTPLGRSVSYLTVINVAEAAGLHRRVSRAEANRNLHKNPEFVARHAERMRQLNANPEFAARHAARKRRLHADPEFRAKLAAGRRRYWERRRKAKTAPEGPA